MSNEKSTTYGAESENQNLNSHKSQNVLSELTVDSPTFTFIEYFLRLNLQASTAKIIQSFEVSNPQLTLQFEKRSKVRTKECIIGIIYMLILMNRMS